MHAIEFEAEVKQDQIQLPAHLHLADGLKVRVLILTDESNKTESQPAMTTANLWSRTSGAWQGEPLSREPQGDFPKRMELE